MKVYELQRDKGLMYSKYESLGVFSSLDKLIEFCNWGGISPFRPNQIIVHDLDTGGRHHMQRWKPKYEWPIDDPLSFL